MNVYFIDPTYVKSEAWKPLLTYLKVKGVYSFIPLQELDKNLYCAINPYIKAIYLDQDLKTFSDNCAFWLRAHFENHIRLIPDKYQHTKDVPMEEMIKHNSFSAYNNLTNLDSENCLILLHLTSNYDYRGIVSPPKCFVDVLRETNLPTHIASFCLNILHKKYQHYKYSMQSSFVMFDKYFKKTYRYQPQIRKWETYTLSYKNGKSAGFMSAIVRNINKLSPVDFPIVEIDGKKRFSYITNDDGNAKYKEFIEEANAKAEEYNDQEWARGEAMSWEQEVAEMNREFWRECGDAGSNCDSWPGWG